ncbi:hypothetical protein RND71_008920 [Anisodus tanguticus]|uniref:Aromatic amino acid beta-eliminating lyase/threonine aldolase domain-containing protein n=1 Tax=Anisodus tanguticus TaxID=243964 RepID=A0AAE1SRV2_9SOLA|nr:hypothetical protein RND71_008920 [Anisodus tanguticus]
MPGKNILDTHIGSLYGYAISVLLVFARSVSRGRARGCTGLLLENLTRGRCLSVEYTDKVGDLAKKYGLRLHIDGARIFNASVALGVPIHRLVQAADSVSAKILRKTLGGGMGQIGVLCAAASVALQENLLSWKAITETPRFWQRNLTKSEGLKLIVLLLRPTLRSRFKPWKQPLAEMKGKAAYNGPLWGQRSVNQSCARLWYNMVYLYYQKGQ